MKKACRFICLLSATVSVIIVAFLLSATSVHAEDQNAHFGYFFQTVESEDEIVSNIIPNMGLHFSYVVSESIKPDIEGTPDNLSLTYKVNGLPFDMNSNATVGSFGIKQDRIQVVAEGSFDYQGKHYDFRAEGVIELEGVLYDYVTIVYDPNGGTGTMDDQIVGIPVNTVLNKNCFTKGTLGFLGWSKTKNGEKEYDDESAFYVEFPENRSKVTLYAVWADAYTIHFDANGGTGDMDDQVIAVGESCKLRYFSFDRDDFVFQGWAETPTGTVKYQNEESVKDLVSSGQTKTLYAVWKAMGAKTVTFNPNGGSGTMTPQTFSNNLNEKLKKNTYVREGYRFVEWLTEPSNSDTAAPYDDEKAYADLIFDDDGNLTLYAQWTFVGTYTVIFDPNGGTGSMDPQTFTVGVSGAIRKNTFSREGNSFSGWTDETNGAVKYTDGQSVSFAVEKDGSKTLYAVWNKTNSGTEGEHNNTPSDEDITNKTEEGTTGEKNKDDDLIDEEKQPAETHQLIKHPGVASTEESEGNIEYWECSICHKLFSDADGKSEITAAQTVIDRLPDARTVEEKPAPVSQSEIVNNKPIDLRIQVSYVKAVTWTGSKITKEQLTALSSDGVIAWIEASGLKEALSNYDDTKVKPSDLFKVSHKISGKNITIGDTKAYFTVEIKLNSKKLKKAGISKDDKKALQAIVDELNKKLEKDPFYFEIRPVKLDEEGVSVSVKAAFSKKKFVQKNEDGTAKKLKSVTIKYKVPAGKNGKTKTITRTIKKAAELKKFSIKITDDTKKKKATADITATADNITFTGTRTGVTVKP